MPGPVFLDGDSIALRTVEEEDLDFLQRGVNDPTVWRAIGRVDPVNHAQERQFYEAVVCESEAVNLLVTTDETPVGIVGLTPAETETHSAELGYWTAREHRREGYTSEAVSLLTSYGFRDRGLHRVSARVFDFNDGSQALLESLGFTHEGVDRESVFVDGAYQDTHWYSVLEHEWEY